MPVEKDTGAARPQISSLSHRYSYKLLASGAALAAGLAMETLLPRALGPIEYGKYNFSIQFFTQILTIISGASTGFAARVARRPKGDGLVRTYFRWLLAMLAIVAAVSALVFAFNFNEILWPTLSLTYVELGCLAAYFTFIGREITGIGDAYGLTIRFETIRVIQRIIALLLLVILFAFHLLNSITAFIFVSVINFALAATLLSEPALKSNAGAVFLLTRDRVAKRAALFLIGVAMPVTALAALSGLSVIMDRWLLQKAGGDTQQGYFSLAYQMIQAVTILAAAMVPLLIREMSIFHDRGDIDRLKSLYTRLLPTLAFAVALPSCFLAREAGLVSLIAGGKEFANSAGAIAPMALVPIYAAYGYVSTTTYFATNKLRLYRNIGIAIYCLSPFLTWLFVAPHAWFGLEMGATGLAIKTLLLAVLLHNSMMFFNCRDLNLSYRRILLQQLSMLCVLGLSASLAHAAGNLLIDPRGNVPLAILEFILNFGLYVSLTVLIIWTVRVLPGLKWREFTNIYRRLRREKL